MRGFIGVVCLFFTTSSNAAFQPVNGSTVVVQAAGGNTTALPNNVTQFGGTNVVTGTGVGGSGIPRVTISNDSSLANNQSSNVSQFGGTNVVTGTGAGGSGIPRVTVSNDSSLAANQSVNVSQIGGSGVTTANVGEQKVSVEISGSSNTIQGTVTANAGSGTFNIQSNASTNLNQISGNSVLTANSGEQKVSVEISGSSNTVNQGGAPWSQNITQISGSAIGTAATGIMKVGLTDGSGNAVTSSNGNLNVNIISSGTASNPWSVQGTLSNNGAAAATNRVGVLTGIVQTDFANGSAFTQGRDVAPNVDTVGNLWVSQQPAMRPVSYYAAFSSATYTTTTDIACLPGNASNTVIVRRITISCTQTTAGIVNFSIIRRSAADSAGTSANITVGKDDSSSAAAVSVPLVYSAAPTRGTIDTMVANFSIGCLASGTASPNDVWIENWNDKAKVLRGTAQEFCISLAAAIDGSGTTVTGGNINGRFEWTETKTLTP